MFAIAYDLDTAKLKTHYHNDSFNNAYVDIRTFMAKFGFTPRQGSLLYGDDTVTMVTAILAVAELSKQFAWLQHSVVDIRILRIEDTDDLMPVIQFQGGS